MNVYDEKMEALIAAALVDGVLTDKEKLVLFKKAQSMGIDLDEFEIILNARLYEMRRGLKVDEQSDIVEESEKEDVLKDADIERQGVLSNVVVEENNVSVKSDSETEHKEPPTKFSEIMNSLGLVGKIKLVLWNITAVFILLQAFWFGWWALLSGFLTIVLMYFLMEFVFNFKSISLWLLSNHLLDTIIGLITLVLVVVEIISFGWWSIFTIIGTLFLAYVLRTILSGNISDIFRWFKN